MPVTWMSDPVARLMDLPLRDGEFASLEQVRRLYRGFHEQEVSFQQPLAEVPVALFITLLEVGYRVGLVADARGVALRFLPSGSAPRDRALLGGGTAAHSLVATSTGKVYSTTSEDRVAVLDASTRKVVGHVSVGRSPQHLALSAGEDRVYSANFDSNDVTVIDTRHNSVVATSGIGPCPLLPCTGPDGNVWIPSRPDGSIAVLDPQGNALAQVPVGVAPHDLAMSPDGRWAYQPNSVSGTVTVIDARAKKAVGDVKVGAGPCHAEFTPDSSLAYVTNTVSNETTVLRTDNHEVIGKILGGIGPHVPVISQDGRWGYIANFVSDDVTVFAVGTSEVATVVPVGTYPHAMSLSPDGQTLVVSNTGGTTVSLLDTATRAVRSTLQVGGAPAHASFDPDGRLVFVACEVDNIVAVIDLEHDTVIDKVPAGAVGD